MRMAQPGTAKKASPEEKAEKIGDQVLALDVKRVADWIQALVRTLKAYRMYMPNNPTLHKFQSDLEARTWSCLKEIGDIVLNVQQFDLLFEDYSVYHNAAREESSNRRSNCCTFRTGFARSPSAKGSSHRN